MMNSIFDSDPFEPVISIGVAARKLGVAPETLRLYEREGLIMPYKTSTNRRLYSVKDLEWVDCFRRQITNNGINIAGIRMLLALIPCWNLKPCKLDDCTQCKVYMNGKLVCWLTPDRGNNACQEEDCRRCKVYRNACRAGKLDEICLAVSDLNE